jgi:hypothetical protein
MLIKVEKELALILNRKIIHLGKSKQHPLFEEKLFQINL